MEKAFWLARWEQNQIGFHEDEVNSHLQAFWPRLALGDGARIFVPLCGKSRDLLWLRAQGHEVLRRGMEQTGRCAISSPRTAWHRCT